MPNQPKTPQHSFRVDDELWDRARALAHANDETVADILRAELRRYVDEGPRSVQSAGHLLAGEQEEVSGNSQPAKTGKKSLTLRSQTT